MSHIKGRGSTLIDAIVAAQITRSKLPDVEKQLGAGMQNNVCETLLLTPRSAPY